MITIDSLRKIAREQNAQPTYHSLGLVRLKYSSTGKHTHPSERDRTYHFYADATAPIYDPIHDHMFSFTSTVLKGTLRSFIYEYDVADYETDYSLCQRTYEDRDNEIVIHQNIEKRESCKFDTPAGSQYSIHYRTLHHVIPVTDVVITYLEKGPTLQSEFNYIQDQKVDFSILQNDTKSVKECWDIIEHVLSHE